MSKDFEKKLSETIAAYKNRYHEAPDRYSVPIIGPSGTVGRLRPVPVQLVGDAARDAALQTDWRNMHKDSFLVDPFTATEERTINWMRATYFPDDGMIIFMVEDLAKTAVGHLGFEHFDCVEKVCEYGRLIRGAVSSVETKQKINLMELAQSCALRWAFETLGVRRIYARLFATNWLSLKLNLRCGFRETERFYVKKHDGTHEMVRIDISHEEFLAKAKGRI